MSHCCVNLELRNYLVLRPTGARAGTSLSSHGPIIQTKAIKPFKKVNDCFAKPTRRNR